MEHRNMGSVLFCLALLFGVCPQILLISLNACLLGKNVNMAIIHSFLKFNLCNMRVLRAKKERPAWSGLSVLELKTKIK